MIYVYKFNKTTYDYAKLTYNTRNELERLDDIVDSLEGQLIAKEDVLAGLEDDVYELEIAIEQGDEETIATMDSYNDLMCMITMAENDVADLEMSLAKYQEQRDDLVEHIQENEQYDYVNPEWLEQKETLFVTLVKE